MRRSLVPLVVAALGAALLGSCAEDTGGGGEATGEGGRVTLRVGVFGAFGFKEAGLYDAYTRLHPNVVIQQTSIARNENYYPQLLTHLGSGSGLADVQAVEVDNIAEITATQSGKLEDLGRAPGVDRAAFLPWKWAQGTARNGKTVGLGTEVADERWFDLEAGDFELGRFVPLQPELDKDVWRWEGWSDFDGLTPSRPDGEEPR